MDNRIDFYVGAKPPSHAGQRQHYIDHMAPAWHALPEESRGCFYVHPFMAEYARGAGIEPTVYQNIPESIQALSEHPGRLVVVAGHAEPATTDHAKRPNAIMYHGVGFVFDKDHEHPSYPGTRRNRAFTQAILCPSERIAAVERDGNPQITIEVVGVPKLDKWHVAEKKVQNTRRPCVALAWHWDCGNHPSTRTAFNEYMTVFNRLRQKYVLLGHGHPHIIAKLRRHYQRMNIEIVDRLDEVFERADLMCADATSAMFEFASLDRPVVVCEGKRYRRADYGGCYSLRTSLGIAAKTPLEFEQAVRKAVTDPEPIAERRRAAVAEAYTYRDGKCAERAAEALLRAAHRLKGG